MGFVGLWIFILGFVTQCLGDCTIEITGAARCLRLLPCSLVLSRFYSRCEYVAGATKRGVLLPLASHATIRVHTSR